MFQQAQQQPIPQQQNLPLSPASQAVAQQHFNIPPSQPMTQSTSSSTQGAITSNQNLGAPMESYGDSDGNTITPNEPKDRILVPRNTWKSKNKNGGINEKSNMDEEDQNTADKRGDYKCSKCGEPKRGHICRNKPRVRAAFVETRDASIQAQLDPNMTIGNLNRALQGYPLSYGFNNTWPTINPVNPFYRMLPNMGQMNPQQFNQMGMNQHLLGMQMGMPMGGLQPPMVNMNQNAQQQMTGMNMNNMGMPQVPQVPQVPPQMNGMQMQQQHMQAFGMPQSTDQNTSHS